MLCDIIMPVWNQHILTKECVDSVLKNTDVDYRLIIIDNASGNETRRYLEEIAGSQKQRVILARNETNKGFIKAANQGFRLSSAPYVCVLNNDTLVTGGWLKTMIDIAQMADDIGIVNPSSNNLGQRPREGESVEDYAARSSEGCGQYVEVGSAIGFCMLIKRIVIDKIGCFDEIYGMGNFEDTDFSRRAVKEGYRCVRACAAYVYHRENSSFSKVKTFEEDFRRNREIYEFRWGKPRRIAYVLDSYDPNILMRLAQDSIRLARAGNWVYYFLKECVAIPAHSNIISVRLPPKNFYLNMIIRILKKKKRFDEIFVGGDSLRGVLERLAFIHKAKVACY